MITLADCVAQTTKFPIREFPSFIYRLLFRAHLASIIPVMILILCAQIKLCSKQQNLLGNVKSYCSTENVPPRHPPRTCLVTCFPSSSLAPQISIGLSSLVSFSWSTYATKPKFFNGYEILSWSTSTTKRIPKKKKKRKISSKIRDRP